MKKTTSSHSELILREFVAYLQKHKLTVNESALEEARALIEEESILWPSDTLKLRLEDTLDIPEEEKRAYHHLYESFFSSYPHAGYANIEEGEKVDKKKRFAVLYRWPYILLQIALVGAFLFLGVRTTDCYIDNRNLWSTLHCLMDQYLPVNVYRSRPRTKTVEQTLREIPKAPEEDLQSRVALVQEEMGFGPQINIQERSLIATDIAPFKANFFDQYGWIIKIGAILLTILSLLFYRWYRTRRFHRFRKLARDDGQAYIPEFEANLSGYPFYSTNELAEILRDREANFALKPEAIKFVFLIEKNSPEDMLAMLWDQLRVSWEGEELQHVRYFYEDDPRLVWKANYLGEKYLSDLHERFPNSELVIIGQASSLFDPVANSLHNWVHLLKPWSHIHFLSLDHPGLWSSQEEVLEEEYDLLPASPQSFSRFKSSLAFGFKPSLDTEISEYPYPPIPDLSGADVYERLSAYFQGYSNRFLEQEEFPDPEIFEQWMASLALFPIFTWDLVLSIAKAIEERKGVKLINAENLFLISRLPWLRDGEIPHDSRFLLIEKLSEEYRKLAADALYKLLEKSTPAAGTSAEVEYRFYLAWADALRKPGIGRRAALAEATTIYTQQNEITDPIILSQVEQLSYSPFKIPMPKGLKRLFYYRGLYSLGFQPWVHVALAAIVLFGIHLLVRPSNPDNLMAFGGEFYNLPDAAAKMKFYTYVGDRYLEDSLDYETAIRNYERSMAFQVAENDPGYLVASYNRGVAHLRQGDWLKAESQFSEVENRSISLLGSQAILDENQYETLSKVQGQAAFNRGIISYRSAQLAEADERFVDASVARPTVLDAKYARALVNIQQAVLLNDQELPQHFQVVLEEIRSIQKEDPNYLQEHTELRSALQSLYFATLNTPMQAYVQSLLDMLQPDNEDLVSRRRAPATFGLTEGQDTLPGGYELIPPYNSEGIARIRKEGKYGFYLKEEGVWVEPVYDFAYPFSNSLAAVKLDGKWGYISMDRKGNLRIPIIFDDARNFQMREGRLIGSVRINEKWGLIELDSQAYSLLTPFIYDLPLYYPANEALALVLRDGNYGYVGIDGEEQISPQYGAATPFQNNRAMVFSQGYRYYIDADKNCAGGNCPPEQWNLAQAFQVSQQSPLLGVCPSPEAQHMFTAGEDSLLRIWTRGRSRAPAYVKVPRAKLNAFAYSADYRLVASAFADGNLTVMDTLGNIISSNQFSGIKINELAFITTEENRMLAACEDGSIRSFVLENDSIAVDTQIQISRSPLKQIDHAHGNNIFLSVSENDTIRLHQSSNGKVLSQFSIDADIRDAQFAIDDERIALATDRTEVLIYHTDGRLVQTLGPHSKGIGRVSFSPSGKYLLSVSGSVAKCWNIDTYQEVFQINTQESPIVYASYTKSGEYILIGQRNGIVRAWVAKKEIPR